MAKGQARSNKEIRKPKKDKAAATAAPAPGGLQIGAKSPMNTKAPKK